MPSSSKKEEALKVLVSGDVQGRFDQLFSRVRTANSKAGPFEFLLCVGDFFGSDPESNERITSGEIQPPIPTYILGPTESEHLDFFPTSSCQELTANLTFLGKKGILYTATGLSIAYLSGVEGSGQEDSSGGSATTFDGDTVQELLVQAAASGPGFSGVDILLSSQWPKSVDKYGGVRLGKEQKQKISESALVSKVATALKPRYHFAGLSGVHYERFPYRNHRVLQDQAEQTTRFIGLASVGNPEKAKFLYAFNITPMKKLTRSQLTEQPPDTSEFPYAEVLRELILAEREKDQGKQTQFFFDMNAKQDEEETDGRGRRGFGRKRQWQGARGDADPKRPPQPCWFCLSSPDVAKHMVISVGDSSYLALAKGGLTPDHVLILPIGHIQSIVAAPEDVRSEIDKFKDALMGLFAEEGKCVVFFERNYRTQHLQIQAVPVDKACAGKLGAAFNKAAELKGLELNQMGEEEKIWDVVNEGCPYFCVELPSGEKFFTRQMKQFPIQFGREVLASEDILEMPERGDWRKCEVDKEREGEITQQFREKFNKFDFTE